MGWRDLFSSRPISLGLAAAATSSAAAPATPPLQTQGEPDDWRRGRWNGRRAEARNLAPNATPARIAAALRDAEAGRPADYFSLLQEVTDRDSQTVAVLGVRKRAVAQRPWAVKAAGDRTRDYRVALWCERVIQGIANFEPACVDLLGAIEAGVGAVEIDWRIEERGGQSWALPRQLEYRPAAWLRPAPGDPNAWHLLSRENLVDGVPLVENRWIVHVAKAKTGFPIQAGLGRVLLWYWLLKHYPLKDWTAYSELFGAPTRVGKAPAGATDEQLQVMSDALAQIGVDSWALLPAGFEMDMKGDSSFRSGPDIYERLISYCDRAIAKLVLGQTLTTEEGQSGTKAQGVVHADVRGDIMRADAAQLARTLTEQLIRPLVLFNWGPAEPVPTFEFQVETRDVKAQAEGQEARGRVYRVGQQMGLKVSARRAREELDLPEPENDDDVLAPLPAAPATDPTPKEPGNAPQG